MKARFHDGNAYQSSLEFPAQPSAPTPHAVRTPQRNLNPINPKAGPASYRLFEMLPMMPRFTVGQVRQRLDTTFPTAGAAVKVLEELGIVTERTGQKKNRNYGYQAYVALMSR